MKRGVAAAKINLALVVGPRRDDGFHEVVTVYQRVALADRITIARAPDVSVTGFDGDTLVRGALESLAEGNGGFSARIEKRIPVASGLGGGSSDAATALRLANELRELPVDASRLRALARELGADVPYFLENGPQLGTGDGGELEPIDLPQDYWVLLVIPHDSHKRSTADVYSAFDARRGEERFPDRKTALLEALNEVRRPRDLVRLPPNDLASSPLAAELIALGAFRADVTGAGPAVYGLFLHGNEVRRAHKEMSPRGRTFVTAPAWYR
jgi:4-diphosphocytidyl-2-C-methyl-D-erythritol kinase